MKPIVLAIVLITISYNVFGQTDTSFANTDLSKMETQKDIYLQTSKSQKTMAFVMLGIGTTTFILGVNKMGNSKKVDDAAGGAGLMFLGVLIDLGSIPFFSASTRNKKKAMSMAVINEPIPKEMVALIKQNSIPALSVKWKF